MSSGSSHDEQIAAKRRYSVHFTFDGTKEDAERVAAAVAVAVDFQHVGPISVTEAERFFWEEDEDELQLRY